MPGSIESAIPPFSIGSCTYSIVLGLLLFVALLVSGSLGVVGLALSLGQGLPLVTEHLADLACCEGQPVAMSQRTACNLTKGDTGVLLANLVTVLVGEEHVGGQTALGRVGVYQGNQNLPSLPVN